MSATERDISAGVNNFSSSRMNDDPLLYQNFNSVTRRDAKNCLDNYTKRLTWKVNDRILDIGCADGSVTNMINSYLPNNYEIIIGCDINSKVVKYANNRYANEKMKFIVLDIEGEMPEDLLGSFNHVFSFYTLHWIRNQEKGFKNIYNLMAEGGECLLSFLAQTPMYSIFQALSKTNKWSQWLSDFESFASPYYDCEDPDNIITNMLKRIGFKNIDVRCKQKLYYHRNTEALKKLAESVSPFKVPEEMTEDLYNDYIEVARDMKMVDEISDKVKYNYNLIIVYCTK